MRIAGLLRLTALAGTLLAIGSGADALAQGTGSATLDVVRARHQLACGVSGESPGFSLADSQGVMRGLDADTCRAVAAAALGDAKLVRFVPLSPVNRFTALQSGEVDILVRNTGWTLTREASLGLLVAFVNFHDGAGFMVKADSGLKSARELGGATVCILPGTSTELDVGDYFRAQKLSFSPVLIDGVTSVEQAFLSGRCDAWANDASYLQAFQKIRGASTVTVLPERISSDPEGALVRKGDDRWFDLVRWTGYALLTAERVGVTSANVDEKRGAQDTAVQRLLGGQGDLGKELGLDNAWAYNIVKQVGNYGELWNQDIAPLGIERGPNRLASDGGLMYAPPLR